ncbi:MAG: proton-conducting transporter membrane subunit [Methyloceanibacter sp.]
MVGSLAHPLNIFILGLGGGFLLPLVELLGKRWVFAAFVSALAAMAAISAVCAVQLYHGAEPIKITTGGSIPPYSINLRMGLAEAFAATSVGLLGLLGALYFVRKKYAVMLLYLLIIMGIQGMVMTRDLFNLFVFLEIVSIATYGLLSLGASSEAQSAAFKFVMATVVASTFFLLGTMFLYAASGMLNIDELIANTDAITGPIGFAALMLLLGCLLLELKPFPANGWGLDVYQTAPGPVAALVASGVSAGVFFALYNLFPLFERYAAVIAALGVSTFVVSNLIGLKQTDAQRLLGYSSVGQMGLLSAALALLHLADGEAAIPLVVGGLFINHFLAKAGLFWLAGYVGKKDLGQWSAVAGRQDALIAFGVLVCALAGMPPFPGFWAKWQLMLALAAHDTWVWIAPILLGSLLEVAFLFRWFGRSLHAGGEPGKSQGDGIALLPVFAVALLLVACGFGAARLSGFTESWLALPLIAGLAFYVLDGLPGRLKGVLTLAVLAAVGHGLIGDLSGIGFLFAWLLYAGCLALAIACLYRADPRPGFHPLLALMLLSLIALPRASTSLEFFYLFELVTLSSYFLIARRREAVPDAFRYLLFSIAAGYILVAGFAMANAVTGSAALAALLAAGRDGGSLFVLLAIGFLIKAGAIGVHVWLPGAYAEADDDLSALLSAVVSKMAIFGLLVGAYAAIRSEADLSLAHVVGWIGMLTALVGAMLALQQDNVKRMLAYSSMSQLGYIVTAIALMSHLGWVTALYLTANHLMTKGILFLVAAAIILRTGARTFADLGGLARSMPLTFAAATIAIVAMSGLPPLAGFGGKWLLLSAMMEKGWYGPIAFGVLATFVGFLYMARFLQTIFLDTPKSTRPGASEAPPALLVSQYLLILGILVMSFFPKLLIVPISEAIDPYFASTLVWEGMSLEMIYGYWNPVPTMVAAVAACALVLGVLWLLRHAHWKSEQFADWQQRPLGFYTFCKRLFVKMTPPLALDFWNGLAARTGTLADATRKIYTGNGQTYVLYVFYYFVTLYAACASLSHI